MGEKVIVGPINQGIRQDRTPFVIDNDSFPTIINAYQWRGRIKRKRGTSQLGRLQRNVSVSIVLTTNAGQTGVLPNTPIVPGTINLLGGTDGTTYKDPLKDGTLTATGGTGVGGSINYLSGSITITAGGGQTVTGTTSYYPLLPVMGLEDLFLDPATFPGTIAFDTKFSYNISTGFPYAIYSVSFYKNLSTGTYPSYVQKTTWAPTIWNGADYQQFWSTNYQGAFWATNGSNIPFSVGSIGMPFKAIAGITVIAGGPPSEVAISIAGHGLVVGDFIFVNEVAGNTGINFQTGYVITITDVNNVRVIFPNATIGGIWTSGGIAQYLTKQPDATKDCLRWYDGDPTDGNTPAPGFLIGKGWVNFCPPISQSNFSIADLPPAQYYLVGARMIVPFKDRLLFIGPVVQTSTINSQVYLQDTVIYSQNGTPYYTCSFTGDPSLATTTFTALLVPKNQTATPSAYWSDSTGYGGFVTAGLQMPINTCSPNQDVLIMGFEGLQTRFVYTGNDILPFNFYITNSEYGSSSTFSIINMNDGVLTRGARAFIMSNQTGSQRFDLDIPDQVFEMRLLNNGQERICAQRDYINEWVYFTYPGSNVAYNFPNQTLQYNYRDNSWSIHYESYTTYGQFKPSSGLTWNTVPYPSWNSWNDAWNAGDSVLYQPELICGNQQGFVMLRDRNTSEQDSLYISDIVVNNITCTNHCLRNGEYIIISNCLGTVSTQVNGNIFSVRIIDANTFALNPPITSATYLGNGTIKKMYVPMIQTRQFPVSWGMARKSRIGVQQYLLTQTPKGQIQLLIYLSQNATSAYNAGSVVPDPGAVNSGLIYSGVLYTCAESTNLGLLPSSLNMDDPTNSNLQQLNIASKPGFGKASNNQAQIWHRINTSLIGDTVQLGFTMSDEQMRDTSLNNQFEEIELHGFIIDVTPSQVLA